MQVIISSHASEAMEERGALEQEVIEAVSTGEMVPAKHGRMRYVKNFHFDSTWRGKYYRTKQIHAITVAEGSSALVVTVMVKYFGKE